MKLIKKTLDRNWQKCWLIFRYHRRPGVVVFFLTVIIATITAIDVERSYKANGKVKLPYYNKSYSNSLLNIQNSFESDQKTLEQGKLFLTSDSLIERLVKELNLNNNQKTLLKYEDFIENLNVDRDLQNKTLNITYTSHNIDVSKSVVNFLTRSYINHQLEINKENLVKIKNNLIEELASAEIQLRDTKIELKSFLKKSNLGTLNSDSDNNLAKLKNLELKIIDAKTQIEQIDRKIKDLKFQLGIYIPSGSEFNSHSVSNKRDLLINESQKNNPGSNIEIVDFSDINFQNNKIKLVRHPPDTKKTFDLDNQKNLLELTEEMITYESDKRIWRSKIEAWKKSQEFYHNIYQEDTSTDRQNYQNLLTKSKAAENKYKTLLIKLHQLEIINNPTNALPIEIEPIIIKNNLGFWNKEIIVLSGIGLGLLLGFVTAFTIDIKNPSLKTSESISQLYNAELLGKIPNLKKFGLAKISNLQATLPERSVLEAPYSLASEAHKTVYKNLQQNTIKKKLKIITIGSPDSQEGKSTFAANLAASTAQLGKKVLLIDANFYEPRQHEIWQLSNHLGLTDLLKNHAKLENIIHSPSFNIDIITTGFVLGDGLSLLQSDAMKQLVNYIKQKYDMTIFDTPSINLYPNALTINKFTDGMILVGKTGVTNFTSMMRTKELIDKSQQVVLGLVVNDKIMKLTK